MPLCLPYSICSTIRKRTECLPPLSLFAKIIHFPLWVFEACSKICHFFISLSLFFFFALSPSRLPSTAPRPVHQASFSFSRKPRRVPKLFLLLILRVTQWLYIKFPNKNDQPTTNQPTSYSFSKFIWHGHTIHMGQLSAAAATALTAAATRARHSTTQ